MSVLVSIIIPTYQRNDLLSLCLDRLQPESQSLSSELYEVIVTDDGGKNTARQLIENKYPWAKWVQGPQKGPAANRNNGAKYASGEWLIFTDDDCLPRSGWLEELFQVTKSVDKKTVLEGKTTCEAGVNGPLMHSPVNLCGGYLWSCNMAVNKSVFWQLGGFDEAFPFPHLEDVDFKERVLAAGYNIKFADKAIVDHPPRKYHTFKKLAMTHESEVYLFAKRRQPISLFAMCKMVFVVKVSTIRRHIFHPDIFVYFLSSIYDICYIVFNFSIWEKKYKQHFIK